MPSNQLEPRLFLASDLDAALELNNANAPAVGEIDRATLEFLIEHSLYSFAISDESLHAFASHLRLVRHTRASITNGSHKNTQILFI